MIPLGGATSRSNNRSDELLQIRCVTNLAISQYSLLPNAFTIGWQSNPDNPQIVRVSRETFIKRLQAIFLNGIILLFNQNESFCFVAELIPIIGAA